MENNPKKKKKLTHVILKDEHGIKNKRKRNIYITFGIYCLILLGGADGKHDG